MDTHSPTTPEAAHSSPQVAGWVAPAGFALLVVTILFLMSLVIASVLGKPVPCNARGLVVFVIALTTGAAAGFLAGTATAEGKLPFIGGNLISIAASGAIATIVIILLIGFPYYVNGGGCPDVPPVIEAIPSEMEVEKATEIATKYWSSVYARKWETAFSLFHPTVKQRLSVTQFAEFASNYVAQFNGPPKEEFLEASEVAPAAIVIRQIAVFDDVSRFREVATFYRDGADWAPFQFDILPIDWPLVNGFRTVSETASAIQSEINAAPENARTKIAAQRFVGAFILPQPGWRLSIEKTVHAGGARTCDLFGRTQDGNVSVELKGVLDSCDLAPGTTIRIAARIVAAYQNIVLDSVRFWL